MSGPTTPEEMYWEMERQRDAQITAMKIRYAQKLDALPEPHVTTDWKWVGDKLVRR